MLEMDKTRRFLPSYRNPLLPPVYKRYLWPVVRSKKYFYQVATGIIQPAAEASEYEVDMIRSPLKRNIQFSLPCSKSQLSNFQFDCTLEVQAIWNHVIEHRCILISSDSYTITFNSLSTWGIRLSCSPGLPRNRKGSADRLYNGYLCLDYFITIFCTRDIGKNEITLKARMLRPKYILLETVGNGTRKKKKKGCDGPSGRTLGSGTRRAASHDDGSGQVWSIQIRRVALSYAI